MRIDYLKYLKAVERYHSITLAAQNMYLGQTTLNTILRNIENELGFSIFYRGSKGFLPTANGNKILALADKILQNYENILNLKDMDECDHVSVPLLVMPSIMNTLAVPLCSAFQCELPKATLEFHEVSYTDLISGLHKNEARIGLIYTDDPEDLQKNSIRYQYQVVPILEDYANLIVDKNHPHANRTSISCHEISGQSIAYLSPTGTCQSLPTWAKPIISNNHTQGYPKTSIILRALEAGNMVALVGKYAAFSIISKQKNSYRLIPIEEAQSTSTKKLCVIHKNKNELNAGETILLRCIFEHFKNFL